MLSNSICPSRVRELQRLWTRLRISIIYHIIIIHVDALIRVYRVHDNDGGGEQHVHIIIYYIPIYNAYIRILSR